MRINSIVMCKNESDFIERFIRINSRVIDHFHIYEDNSSDNTKEILSQLQKEGFSISFHQEVHSSLSKAYHQNYITNYLKDVAHSHCDFIVPLDVDELILTSREVVEQKLSQLEGKQYGLMKWVTCVPTDEDKYSRDYKFNDFFSPMKRELYTNYKAILPSNLWNECVYLMGNHGIVTKNCSPIDLKLNLYHFPIRSEEQLIAKALITAHKFSIKYNRRGPEGYHIIQIADYIRSKNYRLTHGELRTLALSYLGEDPGGGFAYHEEFALAKDCELRYTTDDYPLIRILDSFISEVIK